MLTGRPERATPSRGRVLRIALSAALGCLLLLGMVAAGGHVHHDARESAGCALCAISHTPAVETSAAHGAPNLEFNPVACLVGSERAPDAPLPSSNPARGPPLA